MLLNPAKVNFTRFKLGGAAAAKYKLHKLLNQGTAL